MKQVCVSTRDQWRVWLAENHDKEPGGIWLVYFKKESGKCSLQYEESVEEALCFGWIDSIIRRIDEDSYCRKFTPRKAGSKWSNPNKKRVEKLIRENKMTELGLAKVEAAKRSGKWDIDPRPVIDVDFPRDLAEALRLNPKANDYFLKLPPSHKRQYMGWILSAKRPETRAKRIAECVALLGKCQKLGLK